MPTLPQSDIEKKAWEFAKTAHHGVGRKYSKSSYFDGHVAKVFGLVKQYDTRPIIGAAAILHDTIEDVDDVTYELLVSEFGKKIANLVQELTSDKESVKKLGKSKYLLDKMTHMSTDALFLKLCDRMMNISDMYSSPSDFKKKYYNETKFIIKGLKENRRLTMKHNRVITQIEALLSNVKSRNKFESHILTFESFNNNSKVSIDDMVDCILNGGRIYVDTIKNLPNVDHKVPVNPLSVDEDGLITIEVDGSNYEVDIQNVTKVEF